MVENKTCIIGAGSSGMVAAKVLKEKGLPFDCIEVGSKIGGLWRYNNDNGMSSAYKSLHINSSRREMAFSDFPMPHDYPDFPHHSHIIRYFDSYAEHFGLLDHIEFCSRVEEVTKCDDGYEVIISRNMAKHNAGDGSVPYEPGDVEKRFYKSVIVANGHHWAPKTAEFPGEFEGQAMHSHYYKTTDDFTDKKVLVIGIGNSGCDIACDLSRVAAETVLSTRRGAHIIPKYIFGKPLDVVCPAAFWNYLPTSVLKTFFSACLYLARGRMKRYGLPTPPHKILEEHPTVSADLLNRIGHGQVIVKPNVSGFEGKQVRFVDGTCKDFDAVIYATGYQIKFPFLPENLLRCKANEVKLYRKAIHPEHAGLYFVGLVQPWGPLMPLSEAQCAWIADLISGEGSLPNKEQMLRSIEKERAEMRKRYTDSERHTIQVDFHPYLRQLKLEKKQSLRRGKSSPVETRQLEAPEVLHGKLESASSRRGVLELLQHWGLTGSQDEKASPEPVETSDDNRLQEILPSEPVSESESEQDYVSRKAS